MNIEEDNNQKGNLNTPTQEEEIVVELNSDILKSIQSLQEEIQIFKDDNMNERKEKKSINEALPQNMMDGSPHRQLTHLASKSKKYFYQK